MKPKHLLIGIALYLFLKPKTASNARMNGVRKMRFIPVYKELPSKGKNGKTNIAFSRGKSGVYIIKENGKTVYVGFSRYDLYKTIMRHFYNWFRVDEEGRELDRISYNDKLKRNKYTIRIIFANPRRAAAMEKGLILRHKPRDNQDKLFYIKEEQKEKAKQAVIEYDEAPAEAVPIDDYVPF